MRTAGSYAGRCKNCNHTMSNITQSRPLSTGLERFRLNFLRADRDALVRALTDAGAKVTGSAVRCPFHDDQRASGSIHRDDQGTWRYKCHGCDAAGDVLDIVRRARGVDFPTAMSLLTGSNGHAPPAKQSDLGAACAARLLKDPAAITRLWESRAIDRATAERFGVGISADGRYWTLPIADVGGHVAAVKHHRVNPAGDGTKCFWLPKGTDSRHTWPACLDGPGPVWLCPGELKALAVIAAGRPAVGITGGEAAELPGELADVLRGRPVAIAPDDDDAGAKWGARVVAALTSAGIDARIVDYSADREAGLKDIGDVVRQWAVEDAREPEAVAAALDAAYARAPAAERAIRTAAELIRQYPRLREPVIEGIARQGELVNVIAAPKTGKSWLALDLALSVATGRPWLGHATRTGRVLLLDNELHPETLAHRIPQVAAARAIDIAEYGACVDVQTVRGQDVDLLTVDRCFSGVAPKTYGVVILDALYRFWPRDCDENDNAGITRAYNALDVLAERLRCVFVLIHHASKGSQSGKAVVDVGAGAGAMARATDAHLILRPHEEPNAVVLESAVRSWPPSPPRCLRWAFPIWLDAPDLDPADLRRDRPRQPKAEKLPAEPASLTWTAERFVGEFLSHHPKSKAALFEAVAKLSDKKLSQARASQLFKLAMEENRIHTWDKTPTFDFLRYATIPDPQLTCDECKK